jgi:pimeloyl-ACP methyl ester carboxylesterase
VLHRFIRGVVDQSVVLVGNSMGGLISILQAASEPETVDGLVLVATALPAVPTEIPSSTVVLNYLPRAVPGLGAALLSAQHRTSDPEGLIRSLLDVVTAASDRVLEDVVREHVEPAEVRLQIPGTSVGYQAAAQSTMRSMPRRGTTPRASGPSRRRCCSSRGSGTRSPRSPAPAGSLRATLTGTSRGLPGVGHARMLEVPEQLAGSIKDWATTRLS